MKAKQEQKQTKAPTGLHSWAMGHKQGGLALSGACQKAEGAHTANLCIHAGRAAQKRATRAGGSEHRVHNPVDGRASGDGHWPRRGAVDNSQAGPCTVPGRKYFKFVISTCMQHNMLSMLQRRRAIPSLKGKKCDEGRSGRSAKARHTGDGRFVSACCDSVGWWRKGRWHPQRKKSWTPAWHVPDPPQYPHPG
jgi:hypothetical protein